MFGRTHPQPPQRSGTLSNIFRAATGQKEKAPKVELKETFISNYELNWLKLKDWLDKRFAAYNITFTERYSMSNNEYIVDLPEELTADDNREIAKLKIPRSPVASNIAL